MSRMASLVGCRGEFVTNLGWVCRGDAHESLENDVHPGLRCIWMSVNRVTAKDGERYEARHSLGDTYCVLDD
jgi:hypothetical protein